MKIRHYSTRDLYNMVRCDTRHIRISQRNIHTNQIGCDSGAEICVVNSSVVEGLNLDPIGQVQLRPFCGNTVTAYLVCLSVSLADSDVPSITPNHVVKVTCAVVPDLHDSSF